MQYMVEVSGDVVDRQKKAYVVGSGSPEEAQLAATRHFCNEFAINGDSVLVKSNKRTGRAAAALAVMAIPIFLSFIGWRNGHDTIDISPDYLSCLYAALIYGAFVVRFKGIARAVSSLTDVLFCVFTVLLLSSFIKTILVTETINFLGLAEITVSTSLVLPAAIVLSWLGLKLVSLVCMGAVALAALVNINALNAAMGSVFGPMYVICSFVGIMLYLSVEPVMVETLQQIRRTAVRGAQRLSVEAACAADQAVSLQQAGKKLITKDGTRL